MRRMFFCRITAGWLRAGEVSVGIEAAGAGVSAAGSGADGAWVLMRAALALIRSAAVLTTSAFQISVVPYIRMSVVP